MSPLKDTFTKEWKHREQFISADLPSCRSALPAGLRTQQTAGRRTEELTDEEVPLWVQVGLVGEAALHYVLAVIPTRPQSRESAAVRAVQHLRQSFAAAWRNVDLEQRSNTERSISASASHFSDWGEPLLRASQRLKAASYLLPPPSAVSNSRTPPSAFTLCFTPPPARGPPLEPTRRRRPPDLPRRRPSDSGSGPGPQRELGDIRLTWLRLALSAEPVGSVLLGWAGSWLYEGPVARSQHVNENRGSARPALDLDAAAAGLVSETRSAGEGCPGEAAALSDTLTSNRAAVRTPVQKSRAGDAPHLRECAAEPMGYHSNSPPTLMPRSEIR
ncbi:hypothetical protein AOLI_G00244560 [Acnodon oligacanthus]